MISIVFDAAILILILVCILLGWKRGLLSTLLNLIGTVAAFLGAIYCSGYFSEFIYDNYLKEKIVGTVGEKLASATDVSALTESLGSGLLGGFFKGSDVDGLAGLLSGSGGTVAADIVDAAIAPSVLMLLKIVIFIVAMAVFSLIVGWIVRLATSVNKIPLIGPTNKLLGSIAGAVWGFVICFALATAAKYIISAADIGAKVQPYIDSTRILSLLWTLDADKLLALIGI